MAVKKLKYSFRDATRKVSTDQYMPLQKELMKVLCCRTKQHYYRMRLGIINIPAHVKEDVETVFAKFGITDPRQIWEIIEHSNES